MFKATSMLKCKYCYFKSQLNPVSTVNVKRLDEAEGNVLPFLFIFFMGFVPQSAVPGCALRLLLAFWAMGCSGVPGIELGLTAHVPGCTITLSLVLSYLTVDSVPISKKGKPDNAFLEKKQHTI